MKKAIFAALVALMVLSIVACGGGSKSAADKKEFNIGVLVWKFDDTYGSTVRAAMTKWAKQIGDERGITINLDMQDANDTMSIQIDQAGVMFSKKPDFVIINLAQVSSGKALVDIALENKVPFLFYNKEPVPDSIDYCVKQPGSIFVGTTPREAGDMQGEILADLWNADKSIDKNGDGVLNYVMFQGEPDNPEAIARTKYSVETAEKNGVKLKQLGSTFVCNWDQEQAMNSMGAAIAQYGTQIEVVFANNDMMAMGAVTALNNVGYNTGKAGDPSIVVIGVDAVDSAMESIKQGGMTATVQQDGDAMGKANILLALNKIQGKDWLDGTGYKMADDGYSVRIPYAKITK
jgi:methyl-galactoside transport system substrate-binding protein